MTYASVILDIPTQALDSAYTYALPADLAHAQIGCAVLVPFGGRKAIGYVVGLIEGAEARGIIGPDSIIVEPTSGNQGIGLALVCAVKDYKAVLIMPDSVSHERHELVRQRRGSHHGARRRRYRRMHRTLHRAR